MNAEEIQEFLASVKLMCLFKCQNSGLDLEAYQEGYLKSVSSMLRLYFGFFPSTQECIQRVKSMSDQEATDIVFKAIAKKCGLSRLLASLKTNSQNQN